MALGLNGGHATWAWDEMENVESMSYSVTVEPRYNEDLETKKITCYTRSLAISG